jgi:hypothetical protein
MKQHHGRSLENSTDSEKQNAAQRSESRSRARIDAPGCILPVVKSDR